MLIRLYMLNLLCIPKKFYETSISFYQCQTDNTGKENYRPISLINMDAKILNEMLATRFGSTLKGSYAMSNTLFIIVKTSEQLLRIGHLGCLGGSVC